MHQPPRTCLVLEEVSLFEVRGGAAPSLIDSQSKLAEVNLLPCAYTDFVRPHWIENHHARQLSPNAPFPRIPEQHIQQPTLDIWLRNTCRAVQCRAVDTCPSNMMARQYAFSAQLDRILDANSACGGPPETVISTSTWSAHLHIDGWQLGGKRQKKRARRKIPRQRRRVACT